MTKWSKLSLACKSGDLQAVREIQENSKLKLDSTSNIKKGFSNRFEQLLSEVKNQPNEAAIISALCSFDVDVNELLNESVIFSIVDSERVTTLDALIRGGLDIYRKSNQIKYKSLYDRFLRRSLTYHRIQMVNYLLNIFSYNALYADSICSAITSSDYEDTFEYLDTKLSEVIPGFRTLYNFFFMEALVNRDIQSLKILIPHFNLDKLDKDVFICYLSADPEHIEDIERLISKSNLIIDSTQKPFSTFYNALVDLGVTTDDIIAALNC